MSRQLVFFDLETTGPGDPHPDHDRIVEFSILDGGLGDPEPWTKLVDPGVSIHPDRTEVHGISDEDVADAHPFASYAGSVQATVENAILCGYGIRGYDVPILDRELREAGEAGLERTDSGFITHPEIDLFQAWNVQEPRDLTTAAARFAGVELGEAAHTAEADTAVLPEVLAGMIREFDLPDPAGLPDVGGAADKPAPPEEALDRLIEACRKDGAMDRDGCFRRREDGEVVFDFGKHRGKPVRDHPDYLDWMLRKDFPKETHRLAKHLLQRGR